MLWIQYFSNSILFGSNAFSPSTYALIHKRTASLWHMKTIQEVSYTPSIHCDSSPTEYCPLDSVLRTVIIGLWKTVQELLLSASWPSYD
jgi:hypothetical protein